MALSEYEKKIRLLQVVFAHELIKLKALANPSDTDTADAKAILDTQRPAKQTEYGYTMTLTIT